MFKVIKQKTTLFERTKALIVSQQKQFRQFTNKTRRMIMTVLYELIKVTIYNALSINYSIITNIIDINFISVHTNKRIMPKARLMAAIPDTIVTK